MSYSHLISAEGALGDSASFIFGVKDYDSDDDTGDEKSEEDIRKAVFGKSLSQVHLGNYDTSITRPTVSSARKSVIWSKDRKIYETSSRRRMEEFNANPYHRFEYPEIPRHWPGTWAVVEEEELPGIVTRLTRPTSSRPRTAPVRTWIRNDHDRFKTQKNPLRTVKTAVPRSRVRAM